MAEQEQNVQEEIVQPQEDVNEPEPIQQEENVETQLSQENPPEVGQSSVEDIDEAGVPWKNRAMEFKRKFEDLNSKFTQVVEKIDGIQTTQQPKYTEAQLRAFSQDPSTSTQERVWAEQEIEKMRKEELGKVVESKLSAYQQQQKAEATRQQALYTVQQRHPDAFVKNAQGQIVNWNNKSPLSQRIAQYMQDPEIQKNPRGLLVATAMANWDLSQQSQAKNTQLKQEVRNLQKRTMVEGGGKQQHVQKSPIAKAVERTSSGKREDAVAAMKEMFKARGIIRDD